MEKTERDIYVAGLIGKLLNGDISPDEHLWLENWMDESEDNRELFNKLTDPDHLEKQLKYWNTIDNNAAWQKLQGKLDVIETPRRFKYLSLLKYAAVVLLLLSVSFLLYRGNERSEKKQVNKIAQTPINPGSNHAMLILDNGQKVTLKKHQNISLSEKDGTAVSNQNDVLTYKQNGRDADAAQTPAFNTIMVPRGGEYQLILADGSKVWMNSASTLKYPTTFIGKERKVYLTGEAYFEVAKNTAMPFIVKTNKADVQVLGTHFNVMAYDDELNCKTTLLEGSVRVQSSSGVNVIKPGQQAIINNQGQQKITSDINIEEEMAWKNGFFIFKDAGIKGIMQQAARWYDLDVVYEGDIPEIQFSGKMSRKVDFYGFVNILKYAGLHFNIKGKTVTITK
ncbi:FecR family protein [Mucilaginibacter sp. SG564]|uniref:FecR family protein n=1 Tax=Mucilaginibacter sp. SG564 TaxID=2587022 RepID=UPI001551ACD8|nr:FecR family protein [Mucilaginibacter sp. SG564]NOW93518.1 ferric-dicitrate binding protein FerR (iron transport regulator) [Mucilaginibacter sp. SG564]